MTVGWRFEEHLSSRKAPVISDGKLYVGTFASTAAFDALDAASGKEVWRTDLGAGMEARFNDTAAFTGDLVIVAFGRVLFAFDEATRPGDAIDNARVATVEVQE